MAVVIYNISLTPYGVSHMLLAAKNLIQFQPANIIVHAHWYSPITGLLVRSRFS